MGIGATLVKINPIPQSTKKKSQHEEGNALCEGA